jgi:hypothetical protein
VIDKETTRNYTQDKGTVLIGFRSADSCDLRLNKEFFSGYLQTKTKSTYDLDELRDDEDDELELDDSLLGFSLTDTSVCDVRRRSSKIKS